MKEKDPKNILTFYIVHVNNLLLETPTVSVTGWDSGTVTCVAGTSPQRVGRVKKEKQYSGNYSLIG